MHNLGSFFNLYLTVFLTDSGNVYIWGYGLLGNCQELEQSSNPQLIDKCSFAAKQAVDPIHVVQLSCGLTHFAAVTGACVCVCVCVCKLLYPQTINLLHSHWLCLGNFKMESGVCV